MAWRRPRGSSASVWFVCAVPGERSSRLPQARIHRRRITCQVTMTDRSCPETPPTTASPASAHRIGSSAARKRASPRERVKSQPMRRNRTKAGRAGHDRLS